MNRLGDLLDQDISAFVCPITNGIFEDPVVADDGRTYSRQAIVAWFEGCKSRQVSITSPFTREEISERLVDNFDMKRAIEEFAEKRAKAAADAEQERSQRARCHLLVALRIPPRRPRQSICLSWATYSRTSMACAGYWLRRSTAGSPRNSSSWGRRARGRARYSSA